MKALSAIDSDLRFAKISIKMAFRFSLRRALNSVLLNKWLIISAMNNLMSSSG
jgi:hypothetical protein